MSNADDTTTAFLIIGTLFGGGIFAFHRLWLWSVRVNEAGAEHVRADAARRELIQDQSEQRALELMGEFPRLGDDEIATIMRDELSNRRCRDQRYYAWATVETVARMRRTVLVELMRKRKDLHE